MKTKRLKEAYIKIKRNPMVFIINSIGLSLAIALLIILGLHIQSELSYDDFQPHKKEVVRVEHGFGSITPSAFATFLTDQVPEVENYLRLLLNTEQITHKPINQDPVMVNLNTMFSDSTWSDFFHLEAVYGDVSKALNTQNAAVITQSTANRFFGDENPLGEILYLSGDIPMEVTAVVADYPEQSMFYFDLLININLIKENWGFDEVLIQMNSYNFETFLMLSNADQRIEIEAKCDALVLDRLTNLYADADYYKDKNVVLRPFEDLYFTEVEFSRFKRGSEKTIRFYSIIALFIMLIAIINYVNIATVRSFEYLKSISIKKMYGAQKFALAADIVIEGILVVFLSSLIAILITSLALPSYSAIVGKTILLPSSALFYILVLLIIPAVLGSLVSVFPAIYLTNMRGKGQSFKNEIWIGRLRNSLSFLQFSGTMILLIAISVIYLQVNFMLKFDTGINKENILRVTGNSKALDKSEVYRNKLLSINSIEEVSFSKENPVNVGEFTTFNFKGEEAKHYSKIIYSDCHLLNVFGIELLEGESLSCNSNANKDVCLINKTAAKLYEQDDIFEAEIYGRKVIGVIKDFNFASLHSEVIPLIIAPAKHNYGHFYIKLTGSDMVSTLAQVEQNYKEVFPEYVFDYEFVDEQYHHLYQKETELQSLIPFLGIFAIVISCLGLFSLSVYTTIKKTKVIGIQKVNGAGAFDIVKSLGKNTAKLILWSFVLACPLAYLIMSNWLESFAFRIELSWWIFAMAGLVTAFVAIISISWQIVQAANKNPVEALRYE